MDFYRFIPGQHLVKTEAVRLGGLEVVAVIKVEAVFRFDVPNGLGIFVDHQLHQSGLFRHEGRDVFALLLIQGIVPGFVTLLQLVGEEIIDPFSSRGSALFPPTVD